MPITPGSRLGPYEILGPLGTGGMGEVYRAHDSRLGRDIALKVLRPDVAHDEARLERFGREARAIAALNHPHIVTIFSTEEAAGVRFFTMELVEGQTLDTLVPSGGLSLPRFLDLAIPIADALTAAHQKQITHRDLKPANVMVSGDGRVKVLDFGLARVAEPAPEHTIDATRAALTHEGTIVGTMPYMSPEQVEGRALDHRSDLFSLGVMFYEMLSGARPFHGGSSALLMSAILRDPPPELTEQRADLPDPLVRLVGRCLEKRPDDRIQTARDVYNELRHLQRQIESGGGRRSTATGEVATRHVESSWIAVLPFTSRRSDAEGEAIADGLTEDITAALARFPTLSVVALQSARAFRDSTLDVRQLADRLGARYVMGGSVRRSSSALRIGAHLIDATTGAHLWSDTYDHAIDTANVYAVQDEVTDRIVATVADKYGVLARSMVQAVQLQSIESLSASQLTVRGWSFHFRPTPAEHAEHRAILEAYAASHPDDPHVWANLAHLYVCEHSLWFNPLPDPLGRAERAARRAIELDPGHQEGWETLALVCFHQRDEAGLLEASDRAIKANPRNANTIAWMGAVFGHKGDYDRGCTLVERAMTLNAAHPGWYHFTPFNRHFARRDFAEALKAARRVNIPDFMWMHFAIAAACGHLGLGAEGAAAAERVAALAPPLADESNLREFVSRWYWQPDMIEALLEGVRKTRTTSTTSGATAPAGRLHSAVQPHTVEERPWIAVMPFAAQGGDSDVVSLADGLTDDISAGLSSFSYLAVVAAASVRRAKDTAGDVRQIGEMLGARYLLDGAVRRIADALRITTRLTDARTGAQLWTGTYNRGLRELQLLAVQDDVTDRIVATVADVHGALLRALTQDFEGTPADRLGPLELTLRYWAYHRLHSPAEHERMRAAFERLAEERPTFAFAWSALAHLYWHEHGFLFNPRPEPLERSRRALERALELDPMDQHAWAARALVSFFERDAEGFGHASDRTMALNPRNTNALAFMGILVGHAGDVDRGCTLVERAMTLNPDHPGWYHIAFATRHLARGDFAEALRSAKRINMPQHLWAHVLVAQAAGELGRQTDAAAAIAAIHSLAPALAAPDAMRQAFGRWKWDTAEADRMMEAYRKAVALHAAHGSSSRVTGGQDG